jgi:hypothetical protein
VFAALAVTRWLERRTDWSIKKLITSLRRHHTIEIQAGDQIVTAADPPPDDIRATLCNGSTEASSAQSRASGPAP